MIKRGLPETEIIDKLFLELSQFTNAKTGREIYLEKALEPIKGVWEIVKGGWSGEDDDGGKMWQAISECMKKREGK